MYTTATTIGPRDHGRRMRLAEFDRAEGVEGRLFELSRGVVTVVEVPNPKHFAQVNALRMQLSAYMLSKPGACYAIASGGECKIVVEGLDSERHPDLAVYKEPPSDEEDVWATWIPELVIEVVSADSADRDYRQKPEEYLRFGVQEYWVIDASKQQMLVHRRSRGGWALKTIEPPTKYKTRVLPGFELNLAAVISAAK